MAYKVKSPKELYPAKDILQVLAGIAVVLVLGVMAAHFVTSYAGI